MSDNYLIAPKDSKVHEICRRILKWIIFHPLARFSMGLWWHHRRL